MLNKYQIINDLDALKSFIDFIPDLLPHEQYYITLLARSKYSSVVKNDRQQLKRFTSKKEFIVDKIRQLEVEVGTYKQNGVKIPNEALVLYITINPRDLEVATKKSLIEFATKITKKYDGYNPHQVVLSMIQQSCSRKVYHDFDYDIKDNTTILETIDNISTCINMDACKVLMTRGGFHLLVKYDLIEEKYKNSYFQALSKINGCDVKGDSLVPVVGCTQGKFTPYFYEKGL